MGNSNIFLRLVLGVGMAATLVVARPILPASGSRLGVGERCFRDSSCASGLCTSTWFSRGVCVECESDNDCEGQGQSGPGEHPRAFCFEYTCSQWKRGKPLDEEGYPIWFDMQEEALWIPRQIIQTETVGAVMEQVWHWDLKKQPGGTSIVVNDTHAIFPLNLPTLAAYARTYHQYNEHETGLVTVAFLDNPMSVVTPHALAGMIEKYHTLRYDGKWSTARADRVRAEVQARTLQEENLAVEKRIQRSYKMGTIYGLTNLIDSQLESAQDQIHLDQIRQYVKNEGRFLQGFTSQGWDHHSAKASETLVEAAASATSLKGLKSENHCKHFETDSGITVNGTHLIIPLDTGFTTLSGETLFAPNYYLGLNAGVNVARFDANEQTLEFYYRASQAYRCYSDPKVSPDLLPYPSGLWVTSVAEEYPVDTEIDGRTDQFYTEEPPEHHFAIDWLQDGFLGVPVDYSIYDRPQEVACPPALRDKLREVWARAVLQEASELASSGERPNLFHRFGELFSLLQAAVEGAPCGSSFMKSDYGSNNGGEEGVVGLELLEYSVWAHLILEIDQDHTESMATSTFWDDWQDFFLQT